MKIIALLIRRCLRLIGTIVALLLLLGGWIIPVHATDEFKRLSASEIRTTIIGKVITDESHWSDYFQADGKLKSYQLGHLKFGTWKIEENELCLKRKESEIECFEVWLSNNRVEYHRGGVTVVEGFLHTSWGSLP